MAFYFGAGYSIRSLGGVTGLLGVTYKKFDLQASYTFGFGKSEEVPWYSVDGTDTYLSTMTYKRSTLAFKLGYQVELTDRIGITPQVGYEIERLSGCVSVGAKLLFAPMERIYLFANPAYSIGISKDKNFERIADNSDISAGGFMVTIGAIFNFNF